MANNRLYIVCSECAVDPDVDFKDAVFGFAKYYLPTGWYIGLEAKGHMDNGNMVTDYEQPKEERFNEINNWLQRHHHGVFGNTLLLATESTMPPILGEPDLAEAPMMTREIFDALQKKQLSSA